MREVPPIERALLGALIALVVLICAHAIGGCAPTASLVPPREPKVASCAPSSGSVCGSPGDPPPASPRSGSELGHATKLLRSAGAAASTSRPGHDVDPSAGNVSLRLPPAEGSPLIVARACWLEASFRLRDCASIAYVLRARARRAGTTLRAMTLAYSALDADTPRAALARQLPAGDEPSFTPAENERWAMVRAVASAALQDRVSNPTPGARHWGSRVLPRDVERARRAIDAGRWRLIDARTVNAFYAENR